jgi:hypothetical protein
MMFKLERYQTIMNAIELMSQTGGLYFQVFPTCYGKSEALGVDWLSSQE